MLWLSCSSPQRGRADITSRAGPPEALRSCQTITRRSGSGYGNGFSRAPETNANTVVVAPIPQSQAMMAVSVAPRCERQPRRA